MKKSRNQARQKKAKNLLIEISSKREREPNYKQE